MATSMAPAQPGRLIPPPKANRPPLKVNVYEALQDANAQLAPMFPYLDAESMVPAVSVFQGGPNVSFGQFFHFNTVDEVAIGFGGEGGLQQSGQAMALARLHGVNSFLKDPKDPNSYITVVVVQRQSAIDRDQNEAMIFRCEKCHEVLLRFEYDATPPEEPSAGSEADRYPAFVTQQGSFAATEAFNASESQRTCGKCGRVNPPFPLEAWGWGSWVRQNRLVNRARRNLQHTAVEQLGG